MSNFLSFSNASTANFWLFQVPELKIIDFFRCLNWKFLLFSNVWIETSKIIEDLTKKGGKIEYIE